MRLLIRADAGVEMGTGHVMRSIALGQAWQDAGGTVTFATECAGGALVERLQAEAFLVRRLAPGAGWKELEAVCRQMTPAAAVVDGYHFDSELQERLRGCVRPLMAIDDLAHLPVYSADLVLNQNIHAGDLRYTHAPYTRLLLGPEWALLRREFRPWRGWRREIPETARKLLVVLGGSDPHNLTLRVIRALPDGLEAVILAGSANPHLDSLRDALREIPAITLRSNAADMPALMAWADFAITGAGVTCWEMAFMGLPFAAVIVADNQREVAASLEKSEACLNLGWHEAVTQEGIAAALDALRRSKALREQFSSAGRRLVPGGGADAAVAVIQEMIQRG